MDHHYQIPEPILDNRELTNLDDLNKQFEKITTPSKAISNVKNTGSRIGSSLPAPIKSAAVQTGGHLKNVAGNI
ncbi:MAG: hypothetical protein ACTMH7_03635, partial [Leuconostoc fallax]